MAEFQKPEGFNGGSVSTEALSEQELKWGYWFVTHKEGLKKIGIGMLIAFIVVTFGYTLFALGRFYIFQYQEYEQSLATLPQDLVNVQGIREFTQIQPIEVISRHVLPAGRGRIDIAVLVRNPNTKWGLKSVDYQFSVGSEVYETRQEFLLPGEQKYLVALNVEGVSTGTPQVFFENEQWWRVTNYEQWGPERLNFLITNKKFTAARQTELSGQLPISEVTGELTNATAYNYDAVNVQIVLMAGNRLAGINQIALQDLRSFEQRSLSVRWTQSLPPVSTVEIIPSVNILDESVYQDFEGQIFP